MGQMLTANLHGPEIVEAIRHNGGTVSVRLGEKYNAHMWLSFENVAAAQKFAYGIILAVANARDISTEPPAPTAVKNEDCPECGAEPGFPCGHPMFGGKK